MADWLKLPHDLLLEVVMRFETIEEFLRFSVVCRLWNHFASTIKDEFNVKTMPWLLIVTRTEDDNDHDYLRSVFNPVNYKSYQLERSNISGCLYWGSAYGWIATYNDDRELHLLNPLTKARISLPPVSLAIVKVFVVEVAAPYDIMVFITYSGSGLKLVFARPCDVSWTSIDRPHFKGGVVNVTRMGTRILILFEDTSLWYLDFSDLRDPHKLILKDYLPIRPKMMLRDRRNNVALKASEYKLNGLYLVESRGDLFMVVRDGNGIEEEDGDEADDYTTFGFVVYKLDFEASTWFQVYHIGDVAFFVGHSFSMSFPVIGAGNYKPNCIYFVGDGRNRWNWGKTMGVFDLETNEQEHICIGLDNESIDQSLVWFLPQYN